MWIVKSIYGDFFLAKSVKKLNKKMLMFTGVNITDSGVFYIRKSEIAKIQYNEVEEK